MNDLERLLSKKQTPAGKEEDAMFDAVYAQLDKQGEVGAAGRSRWYWFAAAVTAAAALAVFVQANDDMTAKGGPHEVRFELSCAQCARGTAISMKADDDFVAFYRGPDGVVRWYEGDAVLLDESHALGAYEVHAFAGRPSRDDVKTRFLSGEAHVERRFEVIAP